MTCCSVISFIGDNPGLTAFVAVNVVLGLLAGWSEYLDSKYGERR